MGITGSWCGSDGLDCRVHWNFLYSGYRCNFDNSVLVVKQTGKHIWHYHRYVFSGWDPITSEAGVVVQSVLVARILTDIDSDTVIFKFVIINVGLIDPTTVDTEISYIYHCRREYAHGRCHNNNDFTRKPHCHRKLRYLQEGNGHRQLPEDTKRER